MVCPDKSALIEARVDKILTQYRESPNLIGLIRHDLGQIADVLIEACSFPDEFDIMSAGGDQLTLIGKRLGWPRCHCVCGVVPIAGFNCGPQPVTLDGEIVTLDGDIVTFNPDPAGGTTTNRPLLGFCSGAVWADCQETGTSDLCFDNDKTYRGYLLARRYQIRRLWDIDSLQASVEHIWGATATVVSMGGGRVAVQPGRDLTVQERRELPVAFRVLPIAPGIQPFISYETGPIAGFGEGWGGFCDGATWLCPEPIDPYNCN